MCVFPLVMIMHIGQTCWPTLPVPLGHLIAGVRFWPSPTPSANPLPYSFSPWLFRDLLFHAVLLPLKLFRWSLSLKDVFIHVLAERCPPPLSSHAMGRLQKWSAEWEHGHVTGVTSRPKKLAKTSFLCRATWSLVARVSIVERVPVLCGSHYPQLT